MEEGDASDVDSSVKKPEDDVDRAGREGTDDFKVSLRENEHVAIIPENTTLTQSLNHVILGFSADTVNGSGREIGEDAEPNETFEAEAPPDGGWGWFVVLGSFLIHAFLGGVEKSGGMIYLELLKEFQTSAAVTSLVPSIFTTMMLCGGVVTSALIHRFSSRKVALVGAGITSTGFLLSAFTPNLYFLFFSQGFMGGFGSSFYYTIAVVLVGQYFKKKRSVAIGIVTAGVGVGAFAFPTVIELLFREYGFRGAFIILSAIAANVFVCASLFRPLDLQRKISKRKRIHSQTNNNHVMEHLLTEKSPQTSSENATNHKDTVTHVTETRDQKKRTILSSDISVTISKKRDFKKIQKRQPILEISLLKQYKFFSFCVGQFLFTSGYVIVFVFLSPLATTKGLSDLEAAYIMSISGATDMVFRLVSGLIFNIKMIKAHRYLVYNAVFVIFGLVSFVFPQMNSFAGLAVITVLYFIFSGAFMSQLAVMLVDILGVEKLSSAFGIVMLFQGISIWIGPPVGGVLKDLFGLYDYAFYFGGAAALLGAASLFSGYWWKLHTKARAPDSE